MTVLHMKISPAVAQTAQYKLFGLVHESRILSQLQIKWQKNTKSN